MAGWQLPDGHWTTLDVRPPQSFGTIPATAMAIHGVQAYWPAGHGAELAERTARARAWLLTSAPRDTADLVFRLRGLRWTGAAAADIAQAAAALRSIQRADGGWGQLPSRSSDAFATGDAMLALHESGLPVTDTAYQRGLRFLLDRQLADGSWRVDTRMHEQALVSPPHFETGFPHGEHQMISCMGSTLAVMAVMSALPAVRADVPPLVDPAEWRSADEAPWMMTALFGSVGELRAALDAGLSPNAATAEGTSLLMMASPDIGKVRLLLDRGAEVNLAAKTGFTPLIVALNRREASPVAQLLLDHGARVQPSDPKPVHDASPLFYAIWAGNLEATRALLARGANPKLAMKTRRPGRAHPVRHGRLPERPCHRRPAGRVRTRAERARRLRPVDARRRRAGNDVEMARALIGFGAKLDLVDETSLTALMHAASVDFGDTAMVELLVASGANPGGEVEGWAHGARPGAPSSATRRLRAPLRRRAPRTDPFQSSLDTGRRVRTAAVELCLNWPTPRSARFSQRPASIADGLAVAHLLISHPVAPSAPRNGCLTTEGIDTWDLNVDTVSGAVTLHGKVASEAAKDKAETVAKGIEGVASVKNVLQVVPAPDRKIVDLATGNTHRLETAPPRRGAAPVGGMYGRNQLGCPERQVAAAQG